MYTQNFTGNELFDMLHRIERERLKSRWGCDDDDNCAETLEGLALGYIEGTINFKLKQIGKIFMIDYPESSEEWIVETAILRKLYRNIRELYKVEQANRNRIIMDILGLMKSKQNVYVYRMDVKSFYESIPMKKLLQDLESDCRLSSYSISLLRRLYSSEDGTYCLKRGLCMSALLSEYYMRTFDFALRSHTNVIYYARFVDDIILFVNTKDALESIKKLVVNELKLRKLTLNGRKVEKFTKENSNSESFSYLGYKFYFRDERLHVDIADSKIKKIKKRITRSIAHYCVTHDYSLLKDSIRYLTGNITVNMPFSMKKIRAGIYYNYPLLTDADMIMKELNVYYRSILHTKKNRLGKMIHNNLSAEGLRELNKYSFQTGYAKKIYVHISAQRLSKIKQCWQ
jgi:hypothetical protein